MKTLLQSPHGLLPRFGFTLVIVAFAITMTGCKPNNSTNKQPLSQQTLPVASLAYSVVHAYPHRHSAFSQGLIFADGLLYESTGRYGQSSVAIIELASGKVLKEQPLQEKYFGEGLAFIDNELIQLTWKSGKVFRYDATTLSLNTTQTIEGEGWGLTHHQERLINSDGSSTLYFRDPKSLEVVRQLDVKFSGRSLAKLNELEAIGSLIAANVFQSESIVFIDMDSGAVVATLDLSALIAREQSLGKVDVTNGIAFNAINNTLLVTGKLWRHIYEIRLKPHNVKGLPL